MQQPQPQAGDRQLSSEARAAAWACLRALGCSAHEADDLAQDAVLALLEKQPEADSPGGLLGWARQAARYLFLSHSRTEARRAELIRAKLPPEQLADQTEQEWDALLGGADLEQARAALRQCIETLDRRSRELVQAHHLRAEPVQSAGSRLGMKSAAAHTALHRARARLRECVQQRLVGEGAHRPPDLDGGRPRPPSLESK